MYVNELRSLFDRNYLGDSCKDRFNAQNVLMKLLFWIPKNSHKNSQRYFKNSYNMLGYISSSKNNFHYLARNMFSVVLSTVLFIL